MRINWADFGERVAWTAIQAAAGATLVALTSDRVDWQEAVKIVLIAVAIAVAKVVVAQQAGDRATGDAWPGGTQPSEPLPEGYVRYDPDAR